LRRAAFPILVILGALLVVAGCSWMPWQSTSAARSEAGAGRTEPRAPKAIRVGMAANYPPLSFREEGELVGIEVDLAREVVRETGQAVTIKQLPRAELIPALQSGKIDVIMSGMSVTDARAKQLAFVEPYLRTGQMVLIREQDVPHLGQPARLRDPGRRIAVVGGTTGEQYVRTNLTQSEVVVFPDSETAVRALSAGKVEYFIHDAPSIWRVGMANNADGAGLVGLFTPLTEEYLAWAVRKNDEKLKAQLDAAVLKMKQRGVVDVIVRRWIDTQVEVTPIRLE
jgi:polar amino acid transport system substrate-binding protein